ncbi:MAG: phosphoribosyl-AMP cyclohydrolase [Flammeovirgaceae bacterium]
MDTLLENNLESSLQFEKRGGILPVIVQELPSKEILMLGYVNQEALSESIKTGYATFWSTSRQELWTKGKTSGDFLIIKEILVDCDQDSLIYKVTRLGKGACHTKNSNGKTRTSCFYRKIKNLNELNWISEEVK